jgi:diketogulonate reductase-like aldo/keto reductase
MEEASAALSSNEIVSNQVEYSLVERGIESDLIPYCVKEKVTIIAYSPLARGGLLGGSSRGSKLLEELSRKYGKTKAQIALNWVISKEENIVAIPKADRVEHVKEDCGASGWKLSEDDIKELNKVFS